MKLKQIIACIIAVLMCISNLPVNIKADEPETSEPEGITETVQVKEEQETTIVQSAEPEEQETTPIEQPGDDVADEDQIIEIEPVMVSETIEVSNFGEDDNDELFAGYVDQLFGITPADPQMTLYGYCAGDSLTGAMALAYSGIVQKATAVATGDLGSTQFDFSFEELGFTQHYTAADLGVSAIVSDGEITEEVKNALAEKLLTNEDIGQINNALLVDYPYEFYWYDKTYIGGIQYDASYAIGVAYENGEYVCYFDSGAATFSFSVAEGYRDSDRYKVNTSIAKTAALSASNALKIVEDFKSLSDLDKLTSYKEEICDLTSYNYNAADDSANTPYGDPWQMIWVFDGDESTEVVCEGYSKAFKYLCDQSDFDNSDISCITVSGIMSGGTGAGRHMWNVVAMDDGRNYLVDVTNCDSGSIGADDLLFLVPYTSGSYAEGYSFNCEGNKITYTYDDETKALFGTNLLVISDLPYEEVIITEGKCGDNLTWKLNEEGVLTISGTGDMYSYSSEQPAPWEDYCFDIFSVIIDNGAGSIGESAFANCSNVYDISIPYSVKSIGSEAFRECMSLESITIPYGVTTIDSGTFMYCYGLANITIPDSVTEIGELAFCECVNLKSITIPDSVTRIDAYSFAYCKHLTNIMLPESIEFVSESTFVNCSGLKSIEVESGNTVYDSRDNCNAIIKTASNELVCGCNNTVIPDDVTSIGAYSFSGRNGLKSIEVPGSVTSIGENAFADCTNLTDVYYNGTEEQWNAVIIEAQALPEDVTVHYSSAHEHTYTSEVTKEATCTEAGVMTFTCSACGDIYTEEIPATGHDPAEAVRENEIDATKETEGSYDEVVYCLVCKEEISRESFVIPKLEIKEGWVRNDDDTWSYYVDGNPATGWLKDGSTWYYMNAVGIMQTGWQKVGSVWYYFKAGGAMVTGWQNIGNTWYYFNSGGAMVTGWQKIGDTWYYFNSGGAMATGWQKIGGKDYYFKSSGAMASNEWAKGYWWLNSSGVWTYKYKGSWHKDSKGWWFGDTSGWYARNTTIKIDGKNYIFDASGYMK